MLAAAEEGEAGAGGEGGGAIPLFVATVTAAAPSPRDLFASDMALLPSPPLMAPPDLDDSFLEAVFSNDEGGAGGDGMDLLWDGGGGDVFAI